MVLFFYADWSGFVFINWLTKLANMVTSIIWDSLSEMDGSVADTDLVDIVKRRTREIYPVKTGRASETITNARNACSNDNDTKRSDLRFDYL